MVMLNTAATATSSRKTPTTAQRAIDVHRPSTSSGAEVAPGVGNCRRSVAAILSPKRNATVATSRITHPTTANARWRKYSAAQLQVELANLGFQGFVGGLLIERPA